MKLMCGNTPIQSLKIHYFEQNTNDCDILASDMQAGKMAVARGKFIIGTGKSFEFANYGAMYTNVATPVPTDINVVEVASLDYPIQLSIALSNMCDVDFSTSQAIGNVIVNGTTYPLTASVSNGKLTIACGKTIKLQVFYGKDNYVI